MSSYRMKYKIGNLEHSVVVPQDGYYIFNKKDTVTTSSVYVAPKTGWYLVKAKGGGGGGSYGVCIGIGAISSGGGGEGGTSYRYKWLNVGDSVTCTIGAGGTGGVYGSVSATNGGNSTATFPDGTSVTGYGGNAGSSFGGLGGNGDIPGNTGGSEQVNGWANATTSHAAWPSYQATYGGNGGGGGYGSGGHGGYTVGTSYYGGVAGYQGVITFEYFDPESV